MSTNDYQKRKEKLFFDRLYKKLGISVVLVDRLEDIMGRSRLVCNLGIADFFTLPDSNDVWRKKCGDKTYYVKDGKRTAGYDCESLYDSEKKIWLPGNMRVDLVD